MSRIAVTPETILDRTVARLIDQLDDASDANCYYILEPVKDHLPAPSPASFIYQVSIANGVFDERLFDGGGQQQAVVDCVLAVTIWNTRDLDKLGRDKLFLSDAAHGLLPRATKVLKALAGHDLADESGSQILSQPLFPQGFDIERPERNLGSLQVAFKMRFDWDLS